MRRLAQEYISKLQEDMVDAFDVLDPNTPSFKHDSWLCAQGGLDS